MDPQLAVNYVRRSLMKLCDLHEAAKSLTTEALTRGSVDNVTVLIIAFNVNNEQS
jgi:serine/threonine protein phosphatase PrpC